MNLFERSIASCVLSIFLVPLIFAIFGLCPISGAAMNLGHSLRMSIFAFALMAPVFTASFVFKFVRGKILAFALSSSAAAAYLYCIFGGVPAWGYKFFFALYVFYALVFALSFALFRGRED